MTDYTEIVRELAEEKFTEIFQASGRKAKETYFARHQIKAKSSRRHRRPGDKTRERIVRLFNLLKEHQDDEMVEEILRVWLLSKRPMLAAALDHLGIEHDDGLTESDDLSKITGLGEDDLTILVGKLKEVASVADIEVYLKYLGVSDSAKALEGELAHSDHDLTI
ncbi:MAG: hypothetical protein VYA34_15305 [Myxococcota bacterium]|nr:hypothetical protein [Myxococcota bacterium]